MSLGVLFSCVCLWFFETLPVGITGVLACVLLLTLGVVATPADAFCGFAQSTTWFNFGIFSLTAIMATSTLGARLVARLVARAGAKPDAIVLAFMVACAIVSMFMTDTGAAALVMSLALPLLRGAGEQPGRSNFGKSLMLGISFASVLGGFATPFGHTVNVLNVGLLEQYAGINVTFFEWFGVAFPFSAVMLVVCWRRLVKHFPAYDIRPEGLQAVLADKRISGSWSARDKRSLVVIVAVIAFFIMANWVSVLNTTVVIIIALGIVFCPGIGILTWDEFCEFEGWNVVLMVGGILSIGNAMTETGAGQWIADSFLGSGIMGAPVLVALLVLTAVVYVVHTFCPIAPVLCTLLLPPMMVYAAQAGISPVVMALILSAVTAGNFLVPLNPNMMVTFTQGYYRFGEVAPAGWPPAIVFVVLIAVWSYFAGGLVLPMSA